MQEPYSPGTRDPNTGWSVDQASGFVPPSGVGIHGHPIADIVGLQTTIVVNTPTGVINAYYGTSAPTGWLLCNGGSFSAVTYPALTTLLGGTTLPDLRGRFIMGVAASGTGSTLGATAGSANAIAVTHNHTQDAHGHTQNAHSHTADDDNQGPTTHFVDGDSGSRVCVSAIGATNGLHSAGTEKATFSDVDPHSQHNHTITVDNQTATNQSSTATNQSAGSSGTDANLPPLIAINWIIKAG